jgi:PilZ domain
MAEPPSSEPLSIERRPERRKRVLLGGIIAYAGGKHSLHCTIHDISDTGARVVVRGQKVPSDFYLIHVRDRLAYEAKVVWNEGTEVGVTFKRTFRLADIGDPALSYLVKLWLAQAAR